jgi:predicted PhzF superfamily epimerase YddE/YHI9
MITVHILRAFTNEAGNFGSFAGVVIDEGNHLNEVRRQAIARQLGYEETVFVNDTGNANVSIFSPQREIKFAGVPVVCAAWLLRNIKGESITTVQCLGGEVRTWQDEGLTWVRANLATMPSWHHVQFKNADTVECITTKEGANMQHTVAWAWIDESKGLIRARTFMGDLENPETEGNGSGSMMLAAMLGRSIEIRHGQGSVIFAKPADDNYAEAGGRVVQDEKLRLGE